MSVFMVASAAAPGSGTHTHLGHGRLPRRTALRERFAPEFSLVHVVQGKFSDGVCVGTRFLQILLKIIIPTNPKTYVMQYTSELST